MHLIQQPPHHHLPQARITVISFGKDLTIVNLDKRFCEDLSEDIRTDELMTNWLSEI
jgi:hypothetical protein